MTDSASRMNMRRLRAGGDLQTPGQGLEAGTVPTLEALKRQLDRAIVEAAQNETLVVAFSLRLRALPLAQWGSVDAPATADVATAVVDRMGTLEAEIVTVAGSVDRIRGFVFGLGRRDDADDIANRLILAMRKPFEISGQLVHFDARLGSVLIDDTDPDETYSAAEMALAATDESTPYRTYSRRLRQAVEREELIRRDLAAAIADNTLELSFQPILGVAERRLIGVEAFVRWDHPTLGEIDRPEFLRLAESTQMIYGIGQHVLVRSLEQASAWGRQGVLGPATLWVNFTPAELLRSDFKSMVRDLLPKDTNLTLGLDLSEGPALREKAVCDVVRSLALDDVRAAVDNFGGDYSFLNDLSRLPFDTIKFSRSLIANLGESAGAQRTMALAVELAGRRGLHTVATGVETVEEYNVVSELGVGAVQGYLAGAPMTAARFEEGLSSGRWVERREGT